MKTEKETVWKCMELMSIKDVYHILCRLESPRQLLLHSVAMKRSDGRQKQTQALLVLCTGTNIKRYSGMYKKVRAEMYTRR